MMLKTLNYQYVTEEGSSKKVCSRPAEPSSRPAEPSSLWPFRIKLTPDNLRWDSLKISPSREFEDHILANLNEASLKALDTWCPIEISIYDVDTQESYKLNLAKKELFWFEPMPDIGQKKSKSSSSNAEMRVQTSYDMKMARREFVYSAEPFRHIVKKRNLSYDHEICLRWSGSSNTIDKFDFSVVYPTRLDIDLLKILRG